MQLAIIRHGIAQEAGASTGYHDAPRRLTAEGASRMRAAAAGIHRLGITPEWVITSPLVRCAETAAIVAGATGAQIRTHEVMRPGATTDAILGVLAEYPDSKCLMVCGHQPDLSYLTEELTGGLVEYRRGMLGLVDLASLRPRAGRLVALYPPKSLRLLGASGTPPG